MTNLTMKISPVIHLRIGCDPRHRGNFTTACGRDSSTQEKYSRWTDDPAKATCSDCLQMYQYRDRIISYLNKLSCDVDVRLDGCWQRLDSELTGFDRE